MTDTTDREYYAQIRLLEKAVAGLRNRSTAVRRLAEALAAQADRALSGSGGGSPGAERRAAANELLASYLLAHRGGLPDSLTVFLAVGEALHESQTRQAESLRDQSPRGRSPSATTDTAHAAGSASTVGDSHADPRRFLALADRLRRLREEDNDKPQVWILRRAAGRTAAEAAALLGWKEEDVEDRLLLIESGLAGSPA